MLNGLDLFSGIGGLTRALAPWIRPVAYCEIEQYCRGVLLTRMAAGDLPCAPIWDDVRTLRDTMLPGIGIIYGGFPCQDISVAGAGAGLAGERSGLVREVFRLVQECRPPFVFLENVPAIRTRGADVVVKELASLGYDCRWDCLSAYDVGAPHKRERWFLLAANPQRLQLWNEQGRSGRANRERASVIADAGQACWRFLKPSLCRVDDGLPGDVDSLRALGNAVVPAQAREAFRRLMGFPPQEAPELGGAA